jgi:hypothetical protein
MMEDRYYDYNKEEYMGRAPTFVAQITHAVQCHDPIPGVHGRTFRSCHTAAGRKVTGHAPCSSTWE